MRSFTLALPAVPLAAGVARQRVRAQLATMPDDQLDTLILATSEVVANAVLHGAGPVLVHVRTGPQVVHVEVTDQGTASPRIHRVHRHRRRRRAWTAHGGTARLPLGGGTRPTRARQDRLVRHRPDRAPQHWHCAAVLLKHRDTAGDAGRKVAVRSTSYPASRSARVTLQACARSGSPGSSGPLMPAMRQCSAGARPSPT